MATLFFLWLIVSISFFMIELAGITLFFFISFALGALGAAVAALYAISLWTQVSIFFATSACAFIIMRFIFNPHHYAQRLTNVDILQGKKAVIVKNIVPGVMGQAKVKGEIWAARAINEEILFEGAVVEVIRVEGCHVIVKSLDNERVES
jgi:membrane protein implicated in regulation of membrane protease activity